MLALFDHSAWQLGGHLWWRRWGPDREYLRTWVRHPDNTFTEDCLFDDESIDVELAYWHRGKFPFNQELLDLTWLSQEEGLQLAPDIFGVSHRLDDHGRVVWTED